MYRAAASDADNSRYMDSGRHYTAADSNNLLADTAAADSGVHKSDWHTMIYTDYCNIVLVAVAAIAAAAVAVAEVIVNC